jgi:hypothetical protein
MVLTWLLLLALPLQGHAAVTMVHCGPSHQRMMPTDGPAAHAHHGAVAAPHDSVEAPHGGSHEGGSSVEHLAKLAKFKCSACASCCAGAALPVATLEFDPVIPAAAPVFSVPASHVAFITDGPERPPRPSHA